MQITDDKVVAFNYTLKNDEGQVLDTSDGKQPLAYLHGRKSIVPGLEAAMHGKECGESFNVAIEPEQAYGEHDPQMVQPVPRDRFQGVDEIQPGMQFQANTPAGPRTVTVTDVGEEEVTVDANHPLAGQTLHFDIDIVEVRDATAEELEQGQAH